MRESLGYTNRKWTTCIIHKNPSAELPLPTLGSTLLGTYTAIPGLYDEVLDSSAQLRPHWRKFCQLLDRLGTDEFSRRWNQAQIQLDEHGMAYGAHRAGDDEREGPRPWDLDALPLLIPSSEWAQVSEALVQRAKLLNLVLADLFGPQQLLTRGLLPAEILYSHPGFLRPLHGHVPQNSQYLQVYAADLARSPRGRWWVLADRTEAPSGLGHVLENRIVMSRMLPDVFHTCQIERLAPYFIALRESLAARAPRQRQNPQIVLLSPGAGKPSYFEDTYLARYLGYMLVLGSDLAVRDSRVMLKTLGGLTPIDVILRRTNTASCDPLELHDQGTGGPVGLLQSVRARQVTVANSLGAGLVESPVFQAFLPNLCEKLLGEALKIPNIATWWCGDPGSLEYVLNHIDTMVVRRAFRRRGDELQFNQRIDQMACADLAGMIRAAPREFVAQERVTRSTGPVWTTGGLTSAHIALRTYLTASEGSFVVMQGALARTSTTPQPLDLSILTGEGSKDVWIVSDKPVNQATLLKPQGSEIRLRRSGAELPSRVAEDLLWVGRYLERGDAHARLLRTLVSRLTDELSADAMPELPAMLRALAKQGQIEPGFVVDGIRDGLPAIEQTLPSFVFDETQDGSLRFTVAAFFDTASRVRDRLSLDSWRIVRRINSLLRPPPGSGDLEISDLPAVLDRLIVNLAAFSGLVMESMTRSLGWRFLDFGRRLERAQQIVSLTGSMLEQQHGVPGRLLEALLEAADGTMTYRSRYLADLQVAAVLDLLLTDETNPRSVGYQLAALADHVDSLPRDNSLPQLREEQRLVTTLLHNVRMTDVTALAEMYSLGQWEPLDQILAEIEDQLPRLADAVYQRYLIHAGPSWQLSDVRPENES